MIEIFRVSNKWRVKIVHETLEFKNREEMMGVLANMTNDKERFEPHK